MHPMKFPTKTISHDNNICNTFILPEKNAIVKIKLPVINSPPCERVARAAQPESRIAAECLGGCLP